MKEVLFFIVASILFYSCLNWFFEWLVPYYYGVNMRFLETLFAAISIVFGAVFYLINDYYNEK